MMNWKVCRGHRSAWGFPSGHRQLAEGRRELPTGRCRAFQDRRCADRLVRAISALSDVAIFQISTHAYQQTSRTVPVLPRRTHGIEHARHWIVDENRAAVKALDRHRSESDGSESIAKGLQGTFVRGRDLYNELLNFASPAPQSLATLPSQRLRYRFSVGRCAPDSAAGSGRSMCTLRRAM